MYYIASLAKFGNRWSMVWAHRQGQWKGKNYSLSFSEEEKESYALFLHCIFGLGFLSLRTTRYPSASLSWCSDDLAQSLPCLDLNLKSSLRRNFCLYIHVPVCKTNLQIMVFVPVLSLLFSLSVEALLVYADFKSFPI